MQILQEFTNLGPIVDFDVVDLDQIGQPQLVACCNTGRCGSLRLIRNGIGINEQASIELQGARNQIVHSVGQPVRSNGHRECYLASICSKSCSG